MARRNDWRPDDARVLVVAGRGAREQAIKYRVYQCQNHRGFKPCRWIAFYTDGRIDRYAEIDGPPEDDVVIAQRPELTDLASDMPHTHGDPQEPRCVLLLKNVSSIGPIENDKSDRLGRLTAWAQSQRYTTIDKLRRATHTSEL